MRGFPLILVISGIIIEKQKTNRHRPLGNWKGNPINLRCRGFTVYLLES